MLSDDEDDLTDLWEEVRCNRPAPSSPKPPIVAWGRIVDGGRTPARQGASQGPTTVPTARWVFATVETDDGPIVAFSPIGYFQAMGAAFDRELPEEIAEILPSYLDDVLEATYAFPEDMSDETVRQDLFQLGFTEDQAFTEWLRGQYRQVTALRPELFLDGRSPSDS